MFRLNVETPKKNQLFWQKAFPPSKFGCFGNLSAVPYEDVTRNVPDVTARCRKTAMYPFANTYDTQRKECKKKPVVKGNANFCGKSHERD